LPQPKTSATITSSSIVEITARLFEKLIHIENMELDQEFLKYVVESLVDEPSAVKVNRKVDEMGVLLTLDVAPADMGKIIGRSGNTAKSIRTLLRVVGMKNNARVNLKINEPEGGMRYGQDNNGEASASDKNKVEAADSADVDSAIEDLKA